MSTNGVPVQKSEIMKFVSESEIRGEYELGLPDFGVPTMLLPDLYVNSSDPLIVAIRSNSSFTVSTSLVRKALDAGAIITPLALKIAMSSRYPNFCEVLVADIGKLDIAQRLKLCCAVDQYYSNFLVKKTLITRALIENESVAKALLQGLTQNQCFALMKQQYEISGSNIFQIMLSEHKYSNFGLAKSCLSMDHFVELLDQPTESGNNAFSRAIKTKNKYLIRLLLSGTSPHHRYRLFRRFDKLGDLFFTMLMATVPEDIPEFTDDIDGDMMFTLLSYSRLRLPGSSTIDSRSNPFTQAIKRDQKGLISHLLRKLSSKQRGEICALNSNFELACRMAFFSLKEMLESLNSEQLDHFMNQTDGYGLKPTEMDFSEQRYTPIGQRDYSRVRVLLEYGGVLSEDQLQELHLNEELKKQESVAAAQAVAAAQVFAAAQAVAAAHAVAAQTAAAQAESRSSSFLISFARMVNTMATYLTTPTGSADRNDDVDPQRNNRILLNND